jgi:hypothetical protein
MKMILYKLVEVQDIGDVRWILRTASNGRKIADTGTSGGRGGTVVAMTLVSCTFDRREKCIEALN